MAIYVATLLLLLTSPPSSALDAIEPPTRPQGKSSQEILNGKPFYEYILGSGMIIFIDLKKIVKVNLFV